MLPLYGLDLESKYTEHKDALSSLTEEDIYTAEEMLDQEDKNLFAIKELKPNKSCSFRLSYISSYLFVRGCIERIEEKFSLNKIESIQRFLEIIHNSKYISAWLIFDIADNLGLDREELLAGKNLQKAILEKIKKE